MELACSFSLDFCSQPIKVDKLQSGVYLQEMFVRNETHLVCCYLRRRKNEVLDILTTRLSQSPEV
ncbi:CLUMA_CG015694, isoform A [Clunio marinus]|uniref:CLUMA_CG015694, isoform A n=1 Tax=Clunio marinus TaxID=568069 RepID=A0A1J1ISC0_9DIPT|nr:CLUMA_CG015694, isoform A [Clunio marinus]